MDLKRTARKFWCLSGFVAVIFTLLAIRSIYIAFIFPVFWNIISSILVSIFAYWWLAKILGAGSSCKRSSTNYHGNRDLDL